MDHVITRESFESIASIWADTNHLNWNSIFVLPPWLKVWWQTFNPDAEFYLSAIREEKKIIGIAPLQIKETQASFIGSANVCDYIDFVIVPGFEKDFFNALLEHLKSKGINQLDLNPIRPDSTVSTYLVDIARERGYEVLCRPEDVSVELDLPASFEDYMEILNTKQRHELRRKLRRLSEEGKVEYRSVKGSTDVNEALNIFLKMFTESRKDKAAFLTTQMETYFKSLAETMAETGLTRIGILELDSRPMAMIMYFDYNNCIYLYNSGYDAKHESLSVGLLSKVLCIKDSIQSGKSKFDFLKGNETYKYLLGGREVPISSCQINIV